MRAWNVRSKSLSFLFLVALSAAACAQTGGQPFAGGALNEQGVVTTPDAGYRLYQGVIQY